MSSASRHAGWPRCGRRSEKLTQRFLEATTTGDWATPAPSAAEWRDRRAARDTRTGPAGLPEARPRRPSPGATRRSSSRGRIRPPESPGVADLGSCVAPAGSDLISAMVAAYGRRGRRARRGRARHHGNPAVHRGVRDDHPPAQQQPRRAAGTPEQRDSRSRNRGKLSTSCSVRLTLSDERIDGLRANPVAGSTLQAASGHADLVRGNHDPDCFAGPDDLRLDRAGVSPLRSAASLCSAAPARLEAQVRCGADRRIHAITTRPRSDGQPHCGATSRSWRSRSREGTMTGTS